LRDLHYGFGGCLDFLVAEEPYEEKVLGKPGAHYEEAGGKVNAYFSAETGG